MILGLKGDRIVELYDVVLSELSFSPLRWQRDGECTDAQQKKPFGHTTVNVSSSFEYVCIQKDTTW